MDLHERWIPRAMLGGAALHIAIGLADPRTRDLLDAGLVGALDSDPGREAALWLLALGLAFAALAELARWSVRATGRLPARLGEWLAGIGALIMLVAPTSGGWLVLARGLDDVGRPEKGRFGDAARGAGVQVR
jgi:Family of unknown function (DUF6463)